MNHIMERDAHTTDGWNEAPLGDSVGGQQDDDRGAGTMYCAAYASAKR